MEHAKTMMGGVEFGDPSMPLSTAVDEDGNPLQVEEVDAERASKVMCDNDEGKRGPLTDFEPGDGFCSEW